MVPEMSSSLPNYSVNLTQKYVHSHYQIRVLGILNLRTANARNEHPSLPSKTDNFLKLSMPEQ